jgi:hypothetical protein
VIFKMILFWAIIQFNFLTYSPPHQIEYAGVYLGKSLFIQNSYESSTASFCVLEVLLNGRSLDLNYQSSALIIDFEKIDLFTPVALKIITRDSICHPVIINPDAIFFHSNFKFFKLSISDSVFTWETRGEHGIGLYFIEQLLDGYWKEVLNMPSKGTFESANYEFFPDLELGANKFRIRYDFENENYLYSPELDYEYYPVPVTLLTKSAKNSIQLSRITHYRVYDAGSTLILEGTGSEVDISKLSPGSYVIYFDQKEAAGFIKEP